MTGHSSSASEQETVAKSSGGRIARIAASLGALVGRARRRPIGSAIAFAAVLGAVLAAGVMAARMSPAKVKVPAPPRLADALAALDRSDFAEAVSIAKKLEEQAAASHEHDGGPAFVLGAVAAMRSKDAASAQARRELSLRAVRRLQQAYDRGFPKGRENAGLRLLAECLQELDRAAESIPLLEEGLAVGADSRLRLLRAAAKRQLDPAELESALEDLRAAIERHDLPDELLRAAHLDECRVLALLGEIEPARKSLAQAYGGEPSDRQAKLTSAWIDIREAELLQGAKALGEAEEKVRAALAQIEAVAGGSGLSHADSAAADFLTGLAQRRLAECEDSEEEMRVAIEWLARAGEVHEDRPESIAAAFHEAQAWRELGDYQESLAAWKRLTDRLGQTASIAWPWLTADQMRAGIRSAYQEWVAADEFESAASLSGQLKPLFSVSQAAQMKALALRDWAQATSKKADQAPPAERSAELAKARHLWRDAGAAFLELASARKTSREYPQDLWNSAASHLAGRDYPRAIALLDEYLENERGVNRPPGLIARSEAQLSMGDYKAALAPALECLEFFSRHPLCYRARLLAAQAHEELGDLTAAQKLLEENLYGDALTPASPEWRDSLFALGGLFYRQGARLEAKSRELGVDDPAAVQYAEAIAALEQSYNAFGEATTRLAEAVAPERYPDAPQAMTALYMLGEAHRQRAKWPRKRLGGVMVEAVRADLERRLREDLQAAVTWYDVLRQRLDGRHEDHEPTDIEQAMERNTYFHRADALFDLADYDEAVKAYYSAANRYHESPAALEAFVQIAACQRRLGRWSEAKGTLNQAKIALSRMPTADFASVTRYSREEWAQLLNRLGAL